MSGDRSQWTKEDTLRFRIAVVEEERDNLIGICEEVLEKCSFPVGAMKTKEKLHRAIAEITTETGSWRDE